MSLWSWTVDTSGTFLDVTGRKQAEEATTLSISDGGPACLIRERRRAVPIRITDGGVPAG